MACHSAKAVSATCLQRVCNAVRAKKLAAVCDPTRGTPEVLRALLRCSSKALESALEPRYHTSGAKNEFGVRNSFPPFRQMYSADFAQHAFLERSAAALSNNDVLHAMLTVSF